MIFKKIYIFNATVLLLALGVPLLFDEWHNDAVAALFAVQFCVHILLARYVFIRNSLKLINREGDLIHSLRLSVVMVVLFTSTIFVGVLWNVWYMPLSELNGRSVPQTLLYCLSMGSGITMLFSFGCAIMCLHMKVASGLYNKIID